jgi:GrpB-like predicted nucleotidyltransferase (UPF0157 family)
VPGVYAKPIIDIDIIVSVEENVKNVVRALGEHDRYSYRGEMGISGRHIVEASSDCILPKHHLYVCVDGRVSLRNYLGVKNVLLQDEMLRKNYSEVKLRLAEIEYEHVGLYVEGKSQISQRTLDKCGSLSEDEKEKIRQANKSELASPSATGSMPKNNTRD